MSSFGQRTAADAREDTSAVRRISRITGFDESIVRKRLEQAHGRTMVRTIFHDAWPTTAAALGALTVAKALKLGLRAEIAEATGATRRLVSRRLNATHGKTLVRNALWDWWPAGLPEETSFHPESDVEDEEEWVDLGPDEEDVDEHVEGTAEIVPGKVISSRYEVLRELHRGGFGTTYVAYDRLARLEIVLKIPHENDGGAVEREMRHAFRLLHPGICQAFPERDDETGRPFLVLQHGGEDLAQRLERTKRAFTLPLAVHVLESLADALDYLHERLVVHLDVSPSNVLIDEDDVVRLTDFGASAMAREHLAEDGHRTLLATRVSAFKPFYSAPEVHYREGRSSSDQYSLALVFCSLLEGRVFTRRYHFGGFGVLSARQNEALSKALSDNPRDRFASCADLAHEVADDLGRVSGDVLELDLERLSADLLHRLSRESQPRGRGQARLGGVVLVGRAIERLLHWTLLWMASQDEFDAEGALRELDPRSSGLSRATAGRIAQTIMRRAELPSADAPAVAAIVADLRASGGKSRIWKLINVRNEIIHGTRQPTDLVAAARDLAALIQEHRDAAGW